MSSPMADESNRLDNVIRRLEELNKRASYLQSVTNSTNSAASAKAFQFESTPDVATSDQTPKPNTCSGLSQKPASLTTNQEKYATAFDDGDEVKDTFGQAFNRGSPHDFDFVFVFANPSHLIDFDQVVKGAYSHIRESQGRTKSIASDIQAAKAHMKKLKKENSEEEQEFFEDIHERAETMKQQKIHTNHRIRCHRIKKDGGTRAKRTKSDDSDNLLKVQSDKETGLQLADLLRGFFLEPKQGMQLEVSEDMKNLDEVRSAVLDMFLSFFRGQEEDYYTFLFKSVDLDEIFLCVQMVDKTAIDHAYFSAYPLIFDSEKIKQPFPDGMNIKYPEPLKERSFVVWWRQLLKRFCHTLAKNLDSSFAYEDLLEEHHPEMTGGAVQAKKEYEPLLKQYASETGDGQTSILKKADRIRLLYDRITDVFNVHDIMEWRLLLNFYPLHSLETIDKLNQTWARIGLAYSSTQPMHLIHEYFGDHIALYFVFVEHMLTYLLGLVLISIVLLVVQLYDEAVLDGWKNSHKEVLHILGGNLGNDWYRVFWSICVIFNCVLLNVRLKRKVRTKCTVWGATGDLSSTVKQEVNPRFNRFASITASDLNENEMELNVQWEKRMIGRLASRLSTFAFVLVALGFTVGLLWLQAYYASADNHYMRFLVSIGLTVEIKILSLVWGYLGRWLTDHEYWRTRLHYDNSVAYKNFYVSMITTYGTFYYIAFGMEMFGDHSYRKYGAWQKENGEFMPSEDSWAYLTYQMAIVFGTYFVFSLYDLVSPLINLRWAKWSEEQKTKTIRERDWKYSFIESQSKMLEYSGDLQNEDYMQILLPFGFVLFFGCALPCSAVFCWIYTALQMRVDAWKLCHCMKRPYPRHTDPNSWIWEDIVGAFMQMAIFTNIALISFVLKPMRDSMPEVQWAAFFGLVSATFVLTSVLEAVYPALSERVVLAKRRHEHQRDCAAKRVDKHEDFMHLRAYKNICVGRGIRRLRPEKSVRESTYVHGPVGDDDADSEIPVDSTKTFYHGTDSTSEENPIFQSASRVFS